MGIYIQGMEMPADCRNCLMKQYETYYGQTWCRADKSNRLLADNYKTIPFDGRPDWCPLIEIEPHGRLIDVDGLEPDTEWDAMTDGYISYSQVAIDCAEMVLEPED